MLVRRPERQYAGIGSAQPWLGMAAVSVGIGLAFLLPMAIWILSFIAIALTAGLSARLIDIYRARGHFRRAIGSGPIIRNHLLGIRDEAEFTVFLRPDRLASKVWLPVSPKANDGYSQLPLEEVLRRTFDKPNHQIILFDHDAGHQSSESRRFDWRLRNENAKSLLYRSTRILVLPDAASDGLGLARYLKSEGILAKCVFVMPPSTLIPFERFARYWMDVRTGYESLGVTIVDYVPCGGLITLDAKSQNTLFFIRPGSEIDRRLLEIASLMIGFESAMIGSEEWRDLQSRTTAKLNESIAERLRYADQESWSRFLLGRDRVFYFKNGSKHIFA